MGLGLGVGEGVGVEEGEGVTVGEVVGVVTKLKTSPLIPPLKNQRIPAIPKPKIARNMYFRTFLITQDYIIRVILALRSKKT